jgi:hypothetical protein
MKYLLLGMGIILCGITMYEFFFKGSFDNLIASWGAICLLTYRIERLEEKIDK